VNGKYVGQVNRTIRRLTLGALLVLSEPAPVAAQTAIAAVDRMTANVIRVEITVHGLEVSRSSIRPGRIQLWIQNKTALSSPVLQISTVRPGPRGEEAIARTRLETSRGGTKAWLETTLPPGTYLLSLAHAPTIQTRITVVP
jgi:hypothetical protein